MPLKVQFPLPFIGLELNHQGYTQGQKKSRWSVVVAQLVEQLLPIPEVHGSNPVIGKTLYCTFTVNCIEKTKIKKKRPIKKTNLQRFVSLVTLLGNRHRLH